jgi:rod shape-determining protein MreC
METSRDDFVIAIRSAFLKKDTQQRFSILGLIFFSIIFLILGSFNFKAIDSIKKIIKEIVYTSSFIVSVPENFVKNTYTDISNHFSYYNEYKKIEVELKSLKLKDLSNKILILENIKYKKLVDDYFIKENETFAKVLIDKQSPFLRSIIINKGSKNNIKLGMIVLEEDYLIGKIVEVNYLSSRVLLISDINSKIPVSLQPGDMQAIMAGKNRTQGILQYTKEGLISDKEEFIVVTSGAGGVFKSGIPIGKILGKKNALNKDIVVNFHKDFSQLKFVKVASYFKEKEVIDLLSKTDSKKLDDKIREKTQEQEALRVLLEQKKIADEIRIKIEEENFVLKNKNINLEKEISIAKNTINKSIIDNANIEFLQLNLLHGHKCRKTFYNKLFKVDTKEYRNCIFNKGKKN